MSSASMYDNESRYTAEYDENLNACKKEFRTLFNNSVSDNDLTCVCAPGRTNIIGEHIDYNDGFVLPMAIPLYTILVGAKNNDPNKTCRVKSLEPALGSNSLIEFSLNDLKQRDRSLNWINYVIGVVANFEHELSSFDVVIKSNVPLGSGLSSSAALEIATYTFLENLTNQFSKKEAKALACQKAEHNYASVPCGIMDQFISAMGMRDHVLLIDCRSLETKAIRLENPNVTFLVVNSNVKHQLEGSEYSTRRKQCEYVAGVLGKKSLRDATMEELEAAKSKIDDESYRRAKHAITEISRTIEAARALESNDIARLGTLMNESHNSLRDDFNVSVPEIDNLVDIARASPGVFGSRITGGGFGGCTVTLVSNENVKTLIKNIQEKYKGSPSFYVTKPCDGARKINLN